jgi:hypothetical protein
VNVRSTSCYDGTTVTAAIQQYPRAFVCTCRVERATCLSERHRLAAMQHVPTLRQQLGVSSQKLGSGKQKGTHGDGQRKDGAEASRRYSTKPTGLSRTRPGSEPGASVQRSNKYMGGGGESDVEHSSFRKCSVFRIN